MGLWKYLRNIMLTLVAACVLWIIFHHALSFYEKIKYPPMGELVEVDGKDMHVYIKGDGDQTIVLLSGLGTAAPVLDYYPLIEELAKDKRVVLVEPFGYGWSDMTNKERTAENIVAELRTALQKMNIEPPYILMPHSISGIYSMYFVNTYPEEVEAVIGIDPTLPQALEYFGESVPTMPDYYQYLAPFGVARLAIAIQPENFLPVAKAGVYSEKHLKMTKAISARKISNKNVISEANEMKNNVDKTADMKFPEDMPILIFTTKEDRVTADGKNNVTFFESQLTDSAASKIVVYEGHHYLHWSRYKEISEEVKKFIQAVTADKNSEGH